MKKSLKIFLVILMIVAVGSAGIIYYRTDLFPTQPKDDRKAVNLLKNVDSNLTKVIEINSKDTDINLRKSKSDQVQVKLSGKIPKQDNVELILEKQGNELYVAAIYEENDLKKEKEEEEKSDLPAQLSLDISISSKVYDSISLDTRDGDVLSDLHLQALEIKVDTRAGSSNLTNLSGDQIHFRSDSGDIQLQHIKAGYMTLTSFDGNQSLQDFQGGNLKAETNSGNINVSRIGGGMMSLKTGGGNIKVDSVEPLFASYALITTAKGNVDFHLNAVPNNTYVALTSESGTIKNTLPVKKITDNQNTDYGLKSVKGLVGKEHKASLWISTKEGNITVRH